MGLLGMCCCGCVIHEDTFTRPDDNKLGGSWCDTTDDYGIDDNEAMHIGGGGDALLLIPHPNNSGAMIVSYDTIDEIVDSGQVYRLILNAVRSGSGTSCAASSYYFAEYERQGTTLSQIRLGINSAGVETILATEDVLSETGLTRRFTAHISEDEFCAGLSQTLEGFVGIKNTTGLFANGYYSGFSLSDEDMKIDNFRFEKHRVDDETCASCLCSCEGTPLPPELTVCIYPDPQDCVRLDLLEPCCFTITWDRTQDEWSGNTVCCDGGQGWDIRFTCPNPYTDPETATMTIFTGCTSSCGGCQGPNYPDEVDCDQPCFTFGPYTVSGLDLTCFCSTDTNIFTRGSCTYYVKICGIDCCNL